MGLFLKAFGCKYASMIMNEMKTNVACLLWASKEGKNGPNLQEGDN